jgi:type IV pilus assembly protein PilW
MMPTRKLHKIQIGSLSNSGFTLIELLVTMAMVSIVLAAVISMYTGLSRSYTTETARATAQQDIRSGIILMVQDIRLAGLDPLGSAGGGITLNSPTDIEVIADLDYDGTVTVGNMEQTRYFLLGNQLIQRLDNNGTTDLVLVDNVSALNFILTLDDDGVTPLMVEINMTVTAPAGRTGTITRTLTEQVKIRN